MTSMIPVDDLSAFHIGKVVEISAWNRKSSSPGDVIPASKTVYSGRLEGFMQEGEDRIVISLQSLGQYQFIRKQHKILVRVREKNK